MRFVTGSEKEKNIWMVYDFSVQNGSHPQKILIMSLDPDKPTIMTTSTTHCTFVIFFFLFKNLEMTRIITIDLFCVVHFGWLFFFLSFTF